MSLLSFGNGVLNGTQFAKVGREVTNMATTGNQPPQRTSMAGNIIGGLTGADSQYQSGVLARISDIQTEARTRGVTPDQVVRDRQRQQASTDTVTRYAGSNPIRTSQSLTGSGT
ncbi:hypothetical protein ACFYN0_26830 [Streptomyces sp. NPDC006704]|uniref:hypothetical protein n=1 Tax=Streptomyces sp. NPDC006704 TaxID=3364760 RepID=UPI003679215B